MTFSRTASGRMSWQTTSGDRIETARSAVPAGARREPAARLPGAARRADPVRRGRDRPVRRRRRYRGRRERRARARARAGDFTLAAQVSVEFASTYDAGVLLLHAAERQWAKLCFEYSPQLRPTAVTVVTRGTSDDCNSFEVDGTTLWLRITRSGAAWAFHASADGEWWRLLRYFALSSDPAEMVRVGFLAQSPAGEGCAATFDQQRQIRQAGVGGRPLWRHRFSGFALDRAAHAARAASAPAEFAARHRDDLDAVLLQVGVGGHVPLIGNDHSRLNRQHVAAVIPLLALSGMNVLHGG